MNENLKLWDNVRAVPSTATKDIGGGRLKGMTDINPMWRIKTLTEQFGQCGFGWYYEIIEKRIEIGGNDEQAAFVDIKLFVKQDGEWSKGIEGTGGSSFVAKESKGLYTNDECFKMALTDAISVACKALGFGADIYWSKDNTKYNDTKKDNYVKQSKSTVTTHNKVPKTYTQESIFDFGQNNGKTFGKVYKENPSYFDWLSKNAKDEALKEFSKKLYEFHEKSKVKQTTGDAMFDGQHE